MKTSTRSPRPPRLVRPGAAAGASAGGAAAAVAGGGAGAGAAAAGAGYPAAGAGASDGGATKPSRGTEENVDTQSGGVHGASRAKLGEGGRWLAQRGPDCSAVGHRVGMLHTFTCCLAAGCGRTTVSAHPTRTR